MVVYGLLAAALLLALAARDWWPFEGDPVEEVMLTGDTEQGESLVMALRNGRFTSFNTRVTARCPGGDRRSWSWLPNENVPGVTFRQDGRRLYATEVVRGEWRGDLVMQGDLAEDRRSVSGWISLTAVPSGDDAGRPCFSGIVAFRARAARD